jgi:hypothetical protein
MAELSTVAAVSASLFPPDLQATPANATPDARKPADRKKFLLLMVIV